MRRHLLPGGEKFHASVVFFYLVIYFIAMTYQALGETEKALDWLDRAYDNIENELTWVFQDPEFAGLRTHPHYQALVKKMQEKEHILLLKP